MKIGRQFGMAVVLVAGLLFAGCEKGGDGDDDSGGGNGTPVVQNPWDSFVGHWYRLGDDAYPDRDIDVFVTAQGRVTLLVDNRNRGKRAWRSNVWIGFDDDKWIRFEGTDGVFYNYAGGPKLQLHKVN